jgi:YD repeat-containing protein
LTGPQPSATRKRSSGDAQDARGWVTTYTYDGVGNETLRVYRLGARVTSTYDELSRRTVLFDSTGRTTTSYDATGQITTLIWPGNKVLTYTYNEAGQRGTLRELRPSRQDQGAI